MFSFKAAEFGQLLMRREPIAGWMKKKARVMPGPSLNT
jgi:hypothetical protein